MPQAALVRLLNTTRRIGRLQFHRASLVAAACRRRLARRFGCCGIQFSFPIAHFLYQLLKDTADGFCWQWTAFGKLLSLLYHLLLAAGNRHWQMRCALNVSYLLHGSSALLN